jgi:hypothetical protein
MAEAVVVALDVWTIEVIFKAGFHFILCTFSLFCWTYLWHLLLVLKFDNGRV